MHSGQGVRASMMEPASPRPTTISDKLDMIVNIQHDMRNNIDKLTDIVSRINGEAPSNPNVKEKMPYADNVISGKLALLMDMAQTNSNRLEVITQQLDANL